MTRSLGRSFSLIFGGALTENRNHHANSSNSISRAWFSPSRHEANILRESYSKIKAGSHGCLSLIQCWCSRYIYWQRLRRGNRTSKRLLNRCDSLFSSHPYLTSLSQQQMRYAGPFENPRDKASCRWQLHDSWHDSVAFVWRSILRTEGKVNERYENSWWINTFVNYILNCEAF